MFPFIKARHRQIIFLWQVLSVCLYGSSLKKLTFPMQTNKWNWNVKEKLVKEKVLVCAWLNLHVLHLLLPLQVQFPIQPRTGKKTKRLQVLTILSNFPQRIRMQGKWMDGDMPLSSSSGQAWIPFYPFTTTYLSKTEVTLWLACKPALHVLGVLVGSPTTQRASLQASVMKLWVWTVLNEVTMWWICPLSLK